MTRILIVDDEELLRQALGRVLRSSTTAVKAVEMGSAALQEITSVPYHICFLDIRLPDIDGIEVLKKIMELSPRTKVIMMTAGVVTSSMQECIERNAFMFLPKPFDLLQVKMLAGRIIDGAI